MQNDPRTTAETDTTLWVFVTDGAPARHGGSGLVQHPRTDHTGWGEGSDGVRTQGDALSLGARAFRHAGVAGEGEHEEQIEKIRQEHEAEIEEIRQEYEEQIADLERENERLQRQLIATNKRVEEHTELVRTVERQQSLAERKASAGVLPRAKWWLVGMDDGEN